MLERSLVDIARLRAPGTRRRAAIDALIGAGELEAALADEGDPLETKVCQATDAIASAALGHAVDLVACAETLAHARAPRSLTIRPQDGLAFHALHPGAYAAASEQIDARNVLVIGLRSIGTTLSATTVAALRARGVSAERKTIRAEDVSQALSDSTITAIRRALELQATIVIVDDGPVDDGSLWLAIGDAVVAHGVARERVLFLGSRAVDRAAPIATRFRHAVARSSAFAPTRASTWGPPLDASSGAWRSLHYSNAEHWPAVAAEAEQRKLVAGGRLFKFEGLGSFGRAAVHRAAALAAEGISLDPCEEGDGWLSYRWVGRPMQLVELDTGFLEHVARYCARRPSLCPPASEACDLEPVVMESAAAVFGGASAPSTAASALIVHRMTTVDGRLAPHEWLRMEDGSIRKVDALSHGDDTFFPGPTDIAWDLAGAIVEWGMSRDAKLHLLHAYRRASGDDASKRIDAWIRAYAAVRGAFTLGALETSRAAEAPRLTRELERYRAILRGEEAHASA